MPRVLAPEREHFGGEDGLFSESCNGRTRHFWRCKYCNWEMGGKNFQNNKARIHLSGDPLLRNGMISRVCERAPDDVKQKFTQLEYKKRETTRKKAEKRKRAQELLQRKRFKSEQSTLDGRKCDISDDAVDAAWGQFVFGLDVAINKIANPLFRRAIDMTKRSSVK